VRRITAVVEGDGDQGALPLVVRRYVESQGIFDVSIPKPLNSKGRQKLLREGELERFVQLAARQPSTSAVLVLCDADKDRACELGPEMAARCVKTLPHFPIRVALAVRSFENWFLASPESLAPDPQDPLLDYEAVSAVSRVAPWCAPLKYVKPIQQPSFAGRMDLELSSSRCPSLARLLRCVDELVAEMPPSTPPTADN
jgi:uncharacterized protein DUF4276